MEENKMSMKKIECEIVGETPILMNNPASMLDVQDTTRIKGKKYDQEKEAEKVAYRTIKGELYVPSSAIKGCMLNASKMMKAGKFALRPILAGGVRIEPTEVLLGTKKYEPDLRTVVIQHQRVVKARPKISDWKLKFNIVYNSELISDPNIIRKVLEDGGMRIGILDFRPSNGGEFGTFKVTKFLPKD